MILTFMDGIYRISAEGSSRAELIQEMSLAIHQLMHDEEKYGDYKAPTFDYMGGKPEFS